MFPALSRKVYGKDLVYLDNAATSQRVQTVIDEWNRISAESNANIHRAVHRLADEATQAYEAARDAVKDFLNAAGREEIVFTSGTTAAVNLVAFCYGEAFVNEGDEVEKAFSGRGINFIRVNAEDRFLTALSGDPPCSRNDELWKYLSTCVLLLKQNAMSAFTE